MTKQRFYQGTMVNGDLFDGPEYEGWVFIEWLYPGQNKVRAIKDVKRIEAQIRQENMKGWIANSELDHTVMHGILAKMGADLYGRDEHNLHFKKEVR